MDRLGFCMLKDEEQEQFRGTDIGIEFPIIVVELDEISQRTFYTKLNTNYGIGSNDQTTSSTSKDSNASANCLDPLFKDTDY